MITRLNPAFPHTLPARKMAPDLHFSGEGKTPSDTATTPPPARHKASGWDWFVRIGVAATLAFSAVTATAAVMIEQKVASVERRVPSQAEITKLENKINSRLDALPTPDEIRQTRTDLEQLRRFAEQAGLTGKDSDDLAQRIELLSQRLALLELLLGPQQ